MFDLKKKKVFSLLFPPEALSSGNIVCLAQPSNSSCLADNRVPPASPGMLAGDSGPARGVLALAGEPAGDGEGPRMPWMCGDVCGEKGDWAWLLCSPWLLDTPDVLTPGLSAPSVPVGRSSMDPDRS